MKNYLIFLIFLSSLNGNAGTTLNECSKSENAFHQFLRSIPNKCVVNEDCKIYVVSPGGCENVYAGNIEAEKRFSQKDFFLLKAQVKKNCQEKWNLMGACAPGYDKKTAFCKNERCVAE